MISGHKLAFGQHRQSEIATVVNCAASFGGDFQRRLKHQT
jgi:hypothetical protein